MSILQYSRPFMLTIEAVHILSVGSGNLRSRLMAIDPEFFMLKAEQFPDEGDMRQNTGQLFEAVRRLEPQADEGRLAATFTRSRSSTREGFAKLIWEIYREFSEFMNRNDN